MPTLILPNSQAPLNRQRSQSYLRALCSSSICSLTAFSSFSRATSVPFTHVYTTSMGMGRQSLQKQTHHSRQSSNCDPVCLMISFLGHAWLHLPRFFQITVKTKVKTIFKRHEGKFCVENGLRVCTIFFYTRALLSVTFVHFLRWWWWWWWWFRCIHLWELSFAHLLWKDFPPTLSL